MKTAFLEQFKASGNVSSAARAVGLHRDTHYEWLKTDPAYALAFKDAEEAAIDVLETEARRRALLGIDKPIYFQGKKVDTIKEYSDTLLIFLLKGRRPEVYRERFEHMGRNGGPIETQSVPLDGLTDDELAIVRRLLEKAAAKPGAAK